MSRPYSPETLADRGRCAWCTEPCGRARVEFRQAYSGGAVIWLFCSHGCLAECLDRHFGLSPTQREELLALLDR